MDGGISHEAFLARSQEALNDCQYLAESILDHGTRNAPDKTDKIKRAIDQCVDCLNSCIPPAVSPLLRRV